MESKGGVLSGLPRRPWARAVAATCLLSMTACMTTEWTPLPKPVVPHPQMLLLAPVPVEGARDGAWRFEEMLLASPVLEGDSVLVGPALKGGRVMWVGNDYYAVGRARVDRALLAERHISPTRTTLLVGAIVLGICAWALSPGPEGPKAPPPACTGYFCGSWIF